ncbi:MAG: hypothetical protein ACK5XT_15230 [Gemmatimonas sp.]|uniref:hypothetical protein n=1 Tax=Gemmatimonas sp. TaxID=1962908 RepID=UPI00391FA649
MHDRVIGVRTRVLPPTAVVITHDARIGAAGAVPPVRYRCSLWDEAMISTRFPSTASITASWSESPASRSAERTATPARCMLA